VIVEAQPKEKQAVEQARIQFREGKEAFDDGRYDQAVAHYLEAYRLTPRPALLFNIALAYEKAGESARALEHYKLYIQLEPEGDAIVEARARAQALERTLAEKPEPEPEPPPKPLLMEPRPEQPAPAAPRSFLKHPVLWGGAGLVLAAAGTFFAFRTAADQRELDDLNQTSADHDFSRAAAVIDSGRRNALLANIGFAAAAVAGAAGVYFFVTRPDPAPETRSVAIEAGLGWRASF
jgi:tetratricopeptide (TPR) repeat protein